MQKKNPLYEEVKEDTVWSMDRFNDFVNDNFAQPKNLPEDWVHTVLRVSWNQSSVLQILVSGYVRSEIETNSKW